MPSLYEVIDQLGFITRELAIVGLFLTGGIIAMVRDWRVSLLALLGQYLLAGLVLSRLVLPEVALIKVLIGALICPMLYLAARQAGWGAGQGSASGSTQREVFPAGAFWKSARGYFVPPVDTRALPAALLERFSGEDERAQLIQALTFLTPLTTGSVAMPTGWSRVPENPQKMRLERTDVRS